MNEDTNLKKTLASGAELELTMGGFEECEHLYEAFIAEVGTLNFDESTTFQAFARLSSSKAVKAALWPLMLRGLYNGQKISRETFEPVKERADYFPVAQEVLIFNLRPFFLNLDSQFAAIFKENSGSPK